MENLLEIFTISLLVLNVFLIKKTFDYKKLAYLRNHDSLTGLPMMDLFQNLSIQMAKVAVRNKDNFLAILSCDMDGLKKVNDNFGHATGDTAIATVAKTIKNTVRDTDIIARRQNGGDEFMVMAIVPDIMAANILAGNIEKQVSLIKHPSGLGISIGIELLKPAELSKDHLLQALSKADKKMYVNKKLAYA